MKISVRVKPNSRETGVFEMSDNKYIVKVLSSAREGKANKDTIDALAKYFKVAKNNILIVSGKKSRRKILEIL